MPNKEIKLCKRGHERTPDNVYPNGNCKACKKITGGDHYVANRDAIVARQAAYREANRDAERIVERRANMRSAALYAYGSSCACCGEKIARFLTIDHVNDDGAAHRREIGQGGTKLYQHLRDEGYPAEYRVLCVSCNSGRHVNGGDCPHIAPVKEPANVRQRYGRKLKAGIMNMYGGKCACCGEQELTFLTVDHVNNDGAEHRKEEGLKGGTDIYRWLKNNGYPTGFTVLCFNCNSGRHLNGGTCPHEDES